MKIYLALGANRGHRAAQLAAALAALPQAGIHPVRVSRWRESLPAAGATGRRHFLNAVAEAHTRLLPLTLLRRLRALERRQGRHAPPAGAKKLPRTLDLDLILYGRARIQRRDLVVPHPGLPQRRFVLDGLAELVPGLRTPGSALTARQALRRLRG